MKASAFTLVFVIALLLVGCDTNASVEPDSDSKEPYELWAPVYLAKGSYSGMQYLHKYRDCSMLRFCKVLEYPDYSAAQKDKMTGSKVSCYLCAAREEDEKKYGP